MIHDPIPERFPTRGARRAFAHAAVLALAACNVGFDPRRLESLEPGMAPAEVAPLLDAATEPRLRFHPEVAGGPAGEWRIDHCQAFYPHPNYLLVYRDDRLVAALFACDFEEFGWLERQRGWGRDTIAALPGVVAASKVPFEWRDLEPLDTARHKPGPHPTTSQIVVLSTIGLPGLVLAPIIILPALLFYEDPRIARAALVQRVEALPRPVTFRAVRQALGEPRCSSAHVDDPSVQVWAWTVSEAEGLGVRLAFVDGQLLWADYDYFVLRAFGSRGGGYLSPSR